MKPTFFVSTLLLLIAFNSALIAQLSNSSFESWEGSSIKLTQEQRESLIIGEYIPNESNTGLLPGWKPEMLERVIPSTEKFISLAPGLYENKIFWCEVRIPNNGASGVTFRNCLFAGWDPGEIGDATGGGQPGRDATQALQCWNNNIAQWAMYDCKIDASAWFDASLNPPGGARAGNMSYKLRSVAGFRGGSGTVCRCEITSVQDGIGIIQYSANEEDNSFLKIEGNWIHKMIFYKGVGHHQPEGTHSDCIQFHIGRNITIRGNRIGGIYDSYGYAQNPAYNSGDDAKNSIIMLKQEVNNLPINKLQNVLIEKNVFEGGFYAINHAAANGNSFETTQIENNWFIQRFPTYYVIRPDAFSYCYINNKIATWNVEGVSINVTTTEINYNRGAEPSY